MITFKKPMIYEEGTNLFDYPLVLVKFLEKYKGQNVPLNAQRFNEIWDSLSDEEKATNKEYTIDYNNGFGCEMIIKRNGVIIDTVSF